MSQLSGRVLNDYEPTLSRAGQQPLPRGAAGAPFRERQFPNVGEVRGTSSQMRHTPVGTNEIITGAFYGLQTVVSEDATNGDIYLQGGQVSAGTGSQTFTNRAILLFDASDGPDGTWQGEEGEHLQMAINGEGETADDVLMPVFNMDVDGAEVTIVTDIADDILPEVGSLSGLCNVSLGIFTADGFSPALPGNIQVSFCFGGFNRSRF